MPFARSRNFGCRVSEIEIFGLPAVVMENAPLRVTVLSGKGADILELLYKPRDVDFLWRPPLDPQAPGSFAPSLPPAEGSFSLFYFTGWQEVFPLGSAGVEYRGAKLGQHGEVHGLPWSHDILTDRPDEVSVSFETRCRLTPFRLQRVMTLRSDAPALHIEETVTNEGGEEIDLMWGHHIAFGAPFLGPDCEIQFPAGKATVWGPDRAPGTRLRYAEGLDWPEAFSEDGPVDLSMVAGPDEIEHNQSFVHDMAEGWYAIRNPRLAAAFGLAFDLSVFKTVWDWRIGHKATGAPWWSKGYTVALEPFSTFQVPFDRAVEAGDSLKLGAGESLRTWLTAVAFDGLDPISGIDRNGEVRR